MDGLKKVDSYEFDKDFKDLPLENRIKLIITAKSLLNIQKASRDNVLLVSASNSATTKCQVPNF